MELSKEHIAFIREDLQTRGMVADELSEELDHVCSAVEVKIRLLMLRSPIQSGR